MSEFSKKLEQKLQDLKNFLRDEGMVQFSEEVGEIIDWMEDQETVSFSDLDDFETGEILQYAKDRSKDVRILTLPDINAESEFDALLKDFKAKHPLTYNYF